MLEGKIVFDLKIAKKDSSLARNVIREISLKFNFCFLRILNYQAAANSQIIVERLFGTFH